MCLTNGYQLFTLRNVSQMIEQIIYPSLVLHRVRVVVGSNVRAAAVLRSNLAACQGYRDRARRGHTLAAPPSLPSNVKQYEMHKMPCMPTQNLCFKSIHSISVMISST